ncbi:hypothetical protein [Vibrio tetraodonis]|uniref:hypothetical protein n=1 Tax=Vibrio tetraodonis TaxID=2231647 RepID=UPI0019623B14|nr:hypothetical protein [Vibrio tetraodonis]
MALNSALLDQPDLPRADLPLNIRRISQLSDDTNLPSNIRHLPTLLMMEIRQVGDRMNAIRAAFEDKSPYTANQTSQIVRTLTSSDLPSKYLSTDDKKRVGTSKIFSLDQLSLQKVYSAHAENPNNSQKATSLLRNKPVKLPSRDVEHTVNIDAYLANRLPSGLVDLISKHGAEFFLFNSSDQDAANHYKSQGFDTCFKVSSPTSTRFYLLKNHQTSETKVIVSGIGSHTRLKHQILQFHFSGIDVTTKLTSIGSIDTLKASSIKRLKSQLAQIQADEKILYIGARWKVMESIANKIYNLSGENEGEGYKKLTPHNHKIGPFTFDEVTITNNGKTVSIAALRMPNGELSYDAVKTFAESGFNKIVMCGAGGRIAGDAQVGDYIHLNHSYYEENAVNLSNTEVLIPSEFLRINTTACSNTTVDSPLIETKSWLAQQKETKVATVDVETAHIFNAVNDSPCSITIIPGIFVSDIVGEHPLEDKISGNGADKHIDEFVKVTWNALFQAQN